MLITLNVFAHLIHITVINQIKFYSHFTDKKQGKLIIWNAKKAQQSGNQDTKSPNCDPTLCYKNLQLKPVLQMQENPSDTMTAPTVRLLWACSLPGQKDLLETFFEVYQQLSTIFIINNQVGTVEKKMSK